MNHSVVERYREALERYLPIRGPYYTAFPSPGLWQDDFDSRSFEEALAEVLRAEPERPLQLYVHFPYCDHQCFYCQCFQKVNRNRDEHRRMVEHLIRELDLLEAQFERIGVRPNFVEAHLGGGSPSHLDLDLFEMLIERIGGLMEIGKLAEFAIEIDPRTVDAAKLRRYHELGISRISFGIQDLDPEVQRAINRVQPIELVERLLEQRQLFSGVNFDLIHGLPKQTRATLRRTLEEVVRLAPDRIAFSILGHRPDVFKHNRQIDAEELPSLLERARMWEDSLPFFVENGYELIGMDHFAKPGDELAQAKRERRVYRNLMGYSPGRFEDTIAVGPSAMTRLKNYYFGNVYDISDYYASLDQGRFPVMRGYRLDRERMMRREIMNLIMLHYSVDYAIIERRYGIDFRDHFRAELAALDEFVDLGVMVKNDYGFMLPHLAGYYFLRHVCMKFDNLGLEYRHNIETGVKASTAPRAAGGEAA